MTHVAVKDLEAEQKYYMMGYSSANEWGQYVATIVSVIKNEEPKNITTSGEGMYDVKYNFEGKPEETILLRGSTMFEKYEQVGGRKKRGSRKRNSRKRRNTRR
jgi:hypothetical protein